MMAHMNRIDTRIKVIKELISPFQLQLDKITEICKNDPFNYWDSIYADDTEHIVGTVFIILQNYINSSISDLFPDLSQLYQKFYIDKNVADSSIPRVRLINEISNYYKHRDSPTKLSLNTTNTFDELSIKYIQFEDMDDKQNKIYSYKIGADSPVFNGFGFLSDNWEFNDLIDIVSEWREDMWIQEEKERC
ncbi:MAG: hypothetical protein M0D53_12570 [Flavobacterium sp. JAD_PAG50586_2]|nr:MAG: hypothetical protein M0D53_12570 [Flavobacterium sp. JAD_PAG50586_2]